MHSRTGKQAFVAFALAFAGASPAAADNGTIVRDVTVVSPELAAPRAHADVVLRDGRIARIGTKLASAPRMRVIDGSGRYLVPGLIDSHVHVGHSAALDDDAIDAHPDLWDAYRAQVPRAYLAFGFTSIVDLDLKPRDQAWFEATPLHPRFYTCGRGVHVAGGYGAFHVPALSSKNFPNLVYEPQEAKSWPAGLDPGDFTPEAAVARAAAQHAICIKAFVESGFGVFHWPMLRTGTLAALKRAAKARGLVLMVHANALDSWTSALAAHADIIAHGLWVWPGDPAAAAPSQDAREAVLAAARSGIRVQPTLQVVNGERALFDPAVLDDPRMAFALPAPVLAYLRTPEAEKSRLGLAQEYRKAAPPPGMDKVLAATIERSRATFKLMLAAHVKLIFGSDTPAGDGFGNPPGLNGRLEIQDWADAGASPALILRAATLDNARALGLAQDLGSVEPGKRADLLLLTKNPLDDVSAYDAIETVFLGGEAHARDTLRPAL